MPELPPITSAEQFLLEKEISTRRTPKQARIIGCFACQLRSMPEDSEQRGVAPSSIVACTGIYKSTVDACLKRLVERDVLTADRPSSVPFQGVHVYYRTSGSDVGKAFADRVEPSSICNAIGNTLDGETDQPALETIMRRLVNSCDPETLAQLIDLATARQSELEVGPRNDVSGA